MPKPLCFIRYMGGKFYLLKHILNLLDYSKTCYVELFGGSGKVLLNKKPHKVEIYNDFDYNLYTLFKVVQNEETFSKFKEKLDNFLYMEKMFYDWRALEPKDDVERAVKFYILYNASFAGQLESFGYSFSHNIASTFSNKLKGLSVIKERLRNVTILNRDYKDVLESLKDKTDVMLYADPPYYGTESYYNVSFPKEEHYKLAEYLNQAKYSVLLSYYEFPGIYELYPKTKWNYHYITVTKHSCGVTKLQQRKERPRAVELLICNYKINGNFFVGGNNEEKDRERC